MKVNTLRQSRADGVRRPGSCCPGEAHRYAYSKEGRDSVALARTPEERRDGLVLTAEASDASIRR